MIVSIRYDLESEIAFCTIKGPGTSMKKPGTAQGGPSQAVRYRK